MLLVRKYLFRFYVISVLTLLTGLSYADPMPPYVVLANNIIIESNEEPEFGPLIKKYPLWHLIDGNPGTAWVFEVKQPRLPKLEIRIPMNVNMSRIGIVNGYAKSSYLYNANNIIKTIGIKSKDSEIKWKLKETLDAQFTDWNLVGEDKISLNITEIKKGHKYNDTCISDIFIEIENESLVANKSFIYSVGGEYPELEFYINGVKEREFKPSTIGEAFYINNGEYAVFVHESELGGKGLIVINVNTKNYRHLLKDIYIKKGSIKWVDGKFIGQKVIPSNAMHTKFIKAIKLP